jgi:hypothetical protein
MPLWSKLAKGTYLSNTCTYSWSNSVVFHFGHPKMFHKIMFQFLTNNIYGHSCQVISEEIEMWKDYTHKVMSITHLTQVRWAKNKILIFLLWAYLMKVIPETFMHTKLDIYVWLIIVFRVTYPLIIIWLVADIQKQS